jgi:hypothetical protein|tara:strand:- start:301 stop:507 length:207 start_codon:yes stop_codon:yes gene_type:complete
MKKLIFGVLLLGMGCAPRYEVIQRLEVNMYHLVNTRNHEVEIILTSDSLNVGQLVKKKGIKIIAEIDQ